ncbi:hypothetical protein Bbelb_204680 [Branchiostoma belcheri]|nr:hypothetical protein Bbelb_204680 [Branchiostoma belcheri]
MGSCGGAFGSEPRGPGTYKKHDKDTSDVRKGDKIGGMSGLEPGTCWFQVEHSANEVIRPHEGYRRRTAPISRTCGLRAIGRDRCYITALRRSEPYPASGYPALEMRAHWGSSKTILADPGNSWGWQRDARGVGVPNGFGCWSVRTSECCGNWAMESALKY